MEKFGYLELFWVVMFLLYVLLVIWKLRRDRIRRWSIVSHKAINEEDIIGIVMGTYKVYDKVEDRHVTNTDNVSGANPEIKYVVPRFNEVDWAVVVFDPIHIKKDYVGTTVPIEKLTLIRQMKRKEIKNYKRANTHLRVAMHQGIVNKEVAKANKRKGKESKKKKEDPEAKLNLKISDFIDKEYGSGT